MENLNGFVWLLLLLGPLLFLQRSLQRETQSVFLLITRRADISVALFSLLFFPGVLLHESSHFLMAHLLRVRTGRISLIPRSMPGGRLQLGFVETAATDPFRDALIGVAPLLAGGAFVAYAGLIHLGLPAVWVQFERDSPGSLFEALSTVYHQPDFWLWFYLAFTVSSTMFPSASDRRTWLPIGIFISLLVVLSALAGAGPWLVQHIGPSLNLIMQSVAVVLAISVFIHMILLPPIWGTRLILSRILGLEIVRTP